jgi:hypothetical protein
VVQTGCYETKHAYECISTADLKVAPNEWPESSDLLEKWAEVVVHCKRSKLVLHVTIYSTVKLAFCIAPSHPLFDFLQSQYDTRHGDWNPL